MEMIFLPETASGFRNELQALMFAEVSEVLDVEGCEREIAGEAAGGDPAVVDRSWSTPLLCVRLELSPGSGDALAVGEDQGSSQERLHAGRAFRAPTSDQRPLGQLADGDEGDGDRVSGELSCEDGREPVTDERRATSVSTTMVLTRGWRAYWRRGRRGTPGIPRRTPMGLAGPARQPRRSA